MTIKKLLKMYSTAFIGSSNFFDCLSNEIYNLFLKNIPGGTGIFLRNKFYWLIFKKSSNKFFLEEDVYFRIPKNIQLGNNCFIRKGSCLEVKSNNSYIIIGDNTLIKQGVIISTGIGGFVNLGKNINLGSNVHLMGHGGITIKDNCAIGGYTGIAAVNHCYKKGELLNDKNLERKGIEIGENVWIGIKCTILDGVKIGNNSVIAAGSVVINDIPENCLAAGNPAKIKKIIE